MKNFRVEPRHSSHVTSCVPKTEYCQGIHVGFEKHAFFTKKCSLSLTEKKDRGTLPQKSNEGLIFWCSVDSTLYLGHWSQAEECQASYHLLIGIFLDEHFSNANHFLLPFPLLKTILRARLIRLCMFSLLLSSDQPRQNFF